MRRVVAVVAVALLAGAAARGEEKKAPSLPALPIHQLIVIEVVQQELGLKEDQKKALQDVAAEAREALRGVNRLEQAERQRKQREVREKVQGVLTKQLSEEQQKRLQQINLQQTGPLALQQLRDLAEKLNITQEQRQKMREIGRELQQGITKLREDNRGAELAEKIGKARAEAAGKVAGALTDEQKKMWKEMLGKEFDIAKLQPQR